MSYKPFEISFANHAVDQTSGATVPCLVIVSPVLPARAQMVIGEQIKDLSIAKRPDGYFIISSLLWPDAEIRLKIDAIEAVIVKTLDCANCSFCSNSEFIVIIQRKGQLSAEMPTKQHYVQLSLGEAVGVQQLP